MSLIAKLIGWAMKLPPATALTKIPSGVDGVNAANRDGTTPMTVADDARANGRRSCERFELPNRWPRRRPVPAEPWVEVIDRCDGATLWDEHNLPLRCAALGADRGGVCCFPTSC
jgi:hypothetical protein